MSKALIAVIKNLAATMEVQAKALREIAGEVAEVSGGQVAATVEKVAAEPVEKKKPGRPSKPKAEDKSDADPLAGLADAAESEEPEQPAEEDTGAVDADPLAGLGLGGEPEPEPAVTREQLAKVLGEMSGLVDKAKGKGTGSQALLAMFKKHGAENLKTLAEDEFLGVKNEAEAIIAAVKKLLA